MYFNIGRQTPIGIAPNDIFMVGDEAMTYDINNIRAVRI
jgi:hypothetical protein